MDKLKPEDMKALNDRIRNVMREMAGIPASAGICEPVEGFEALPEHAVYCMRDMTKQLSAANARIAELEEELELFARENGSLVEKAYAEGWSDSDEYYGYDKEEWEASRAKGYVRRAAALLEKK